MACRVTFSALLHHVPVEANKKEFPLCFEYQLANPWKMTCDRNVGWQRRELLMRREYLVCSSGQGPVPRCGWVERQQETGSELSVLRWKQGCVRPSHSECFSGQVPSLYRVAEKPWARACQSCDFAIAPHAKSWFFVMRVCLLWALKIGLNVEARGGSSGGSGGE